MQLVKCNQLPNPLNKLGKRYHMHAMGELSNELVSYSTECSLTQFVGLALVSVLICERPLIHPVVASCMIHEIDPHVLLCKLFAFVRSVIFLCYQNIFLDVGEVDLVC